MEDFSDFSLKVMCADCGFEHARWLTCYSAAKNRYTAETGLEFWTGESIIRAEVGKSLRAPEGKTLKVGNA